MNILVTGGAGYVGAHACLELLQAGHAVVVLDSLVNSKRAAVDRVAELAGAPVELVVADLRDADALRSVFERSSFDAVMHFAGLKAIGESIERPVEYFDANVGGALSLLGEMDRHGVRTVVFSSSAAVYGDTLTVPIAEDAPLRPTSPYGWSKWMVERVLRDLHASDPRWSATLLRYFNPAGAHPSGGLGEDPPDAPQGLAPVIAEVAAGSLQALPVFGDDFPTPDGTGVRDYVHVVDLALGHVVALGAHADTPGVHVYNLGAGQGVSVHDMRRAFEAACGAPIPYEVLARRAGDVAQCYADTSRARERLGWVASRSLDDIVRDAWRWRRGQPDAAL